MKYTTMVIGNQWNTQIYVPGFVGIKGLHVYNEHGTAVFYVDCDDEHLDVQTGVEVMTYQNAPFESPYILLDTRYRPGGGVMRVGYMTNNFTPSVAKSVTFRGRVYYSPDFVFYLRGFQSIDRVKCPEGNPFMADITARYIPSATAEVSKISIATVGPDPYLIPAGAIELGAYSLFGQTDYLYYTVETVTP